MNFSDIMAEAVLSIKKSCLVAHATHSVAAVLKRFFEKVKREITRCSVRCFMRNIQTIHVSETQFACIPSKN